MSDLTGGSRNFSDTRQIGGGKAPPVRRNVPKSLGANKPYDRSQSLLSRFGRKVKDFLTPSTWFGGFGSGEKPQESEALAREHAAEPEAVRAGDSREGAESDRLPWSFIDTTRLQRPALRSSWTLSDARDSLAQPGERGSAVRAMPSHSAEPSWTLDYSDKQLKVIGGGKPASDVRLVGRWEAQGSWERAGGFERTSGKSEPVESSELRSESDPDRILKSTAWREPEHGCGLMSLAGWESPGELEQEDELEASREDLVVRSEAGELIDGEGGSEGCLMSSKAGLGSVDEGSSEGLMISSKAGMGSVDEGSSEGPMISSKAGVGSVEEGGRMSGVSAGVSDAQIDATAGAPDQKMKSEERDGAFNYTGLWSIRDQPQPKPQPNPLSLQRPQLNPFHQPQSFLNPFFEKLKPMSSTFLDQKPAFNPFLARKPASSTFSESKQAPTPFLPLTEQCDTLLANQSAASTSSNQKPALGLTNESSAIVDCSLTLSMLQGSYQDSCQDPSQVCRAVVQQSVLARPTSSCGEQRMCVMSATTRRVLASMDRPTTVTINQSRHNKLPNTSVTDESRSSLEGAPQTASSAVPRVTESTYLRLSARFDNGGQGGGGQETTRTPVNRLATPPAIQSAHTRDRFLQASGATVADMRPAVYHAAGSETDLTKTARGTDAFKSSSGGRISGGGGGRDVGGGQGVGRGGGRGKARKPPRHCSSKSSDCAGGMDPSLWTVQPLEMTALAPCSFGMATGPFTFSYPLEHNRMRGPGPLGDDKISRTEPMFHFSDPAQPLDQVYTVLEGRTVTSENVGEEGAREGFKIKNKSGRVGGLERQKESEADDGKIMSSDVINIAEGSHDSDSGEVLGVVSLVVGHTVGLLGMSEAAVVCHGLVEAAAASLGFFRPPNTACGAFGPPVIEVNSSRIKDDVLSGCKTSDDKSGPHVVSDADDSSSRPVHVNTVSGNADVNNPDQVHANDSNTADPNPVTVNTDELCIATLVSSHKEEIASLPAPNETIGVDIVDTSSDDVDVGSKSFLLEIPDILSVNVGDDLAMTGVEELGANVEVLLDSGDTTLPVDSLDDFISTSPVYETGSTTDINLSPVNESGTATGVSPSPVNECGCTTQVNAFPVNESSSTTNVNAPQL